MVTDNRFTGAISDSATRFDGARILRPQINFPVFRYYRLERGVLIRQEDQLKTSAKDAAEDGIANVLSAIQAADEALRDLTSAVLPVPSHGEIGHNEPPIEFVLGPADLTEAAIALDSIRAEISNPIPNSDILRQNRKRVGEYALKVAQWAAAKANIFTEEFVKSLGQKAASPAGLLSIALVFSGRWTALVDIIIKYFG